MSEGPATLRRVLFDTNVVLDVLVYEPPALLDELAAEG